MFCRVLSSPSFEVLARGLSLSLLDQLIKFTPKASPLLGSHTVGCCTFVLIAPGPGARWPGTASVLQILLKWSVLSLLALPHLFLLVETTGKALVLICPSSPPPDLPGVSLGGPVWHGVLCSQEPVSRTNPWHSF